MFKRGGFASYTKTGRRIQYGAAIGSAMTPQQAKPVGAILLMLSNRQRDSLVQCSAFWQMHILRNKGSTPTVRRRPESCSSSIQNLRRTKQQYCHLLKKTDSLNSQKKLSLSFADAASMSATMTSSRLVSATLVMTRSERLIA